MSYALAGVLQSAVFAALSADPALAAEVGGAVYDAVPPGELPDLYVILGEERVRDRSDATGPGAVHDFTISVLSSAAGFARAKAAAAAVSELLERADLTLERGRLIGLHFRRAKAARLGSGDRRRIDISFRARVQGD